MSRENRRKEWGVFLKTKGIWRRVHCKEKGVSEEIRVGAEAKDEDEAGAGADTVNEGVSEENRVGAEAGAGAGVDTVHEGVSEENGVGAEAEDEAETGAGAETVNEGVSEEIGVGTEDGAGARAETVNEGPGIGVGEDEGDENSEEDAEYEEGGASEDDDTSSSASECPSWMLEDLEGPMDDDLFKKRVEQENVEASVGEDGWFSDVGGEDDLHSLRGSDDEIGDSVVWNDSMERQDLDLCIGMKFATRVKYREVLRDWAVRRGWDLTFVKNQKSKITTVCKNGCDWRIHASPVMSTTTFQIKSIKGKHTCAHKIDNKQANYKYIGKRIQQFVRDNPSEGLESLKNKIRRDIQVDVSLYKVYRAKKFAFELMKGDIKQQYNRLYDYCATVCKHNPESSMILKVDRGLNPPILQRMYCCFGGLKKGFLDRCRPFIGLDGCFLKGLHKGQLLSAIGRDDNDNIYPIAMAYVEIEKFDSWEWFLNLLLRDIGLHNERGWAFISDRQKGLIEVVTQLAPQAKHRFCLRHMYNNFKAKFKGQQLKKTILEGCFHIQCKKAP
ncbi:UNVERIFIED_CONTAM: hypothetical protein Sradi_6179400 [Sesamum radiatum]|uniref:Uncharacterized protein n=1 Tax=Sesamum radiatum TaxID=300843 RepID=A0AAW2KBA9_SESRA